MRGFSFRRAIPAQIISYSREKASNFVLILYKNSLFLVKISEKIWHFLNSIEKRGTELFRFDIVNIMDVNALAMQGAKTSVPMILTIEDRYMCKFLPYTRKDFNYLCHVILGGR